MKYAETVESIMECRDILDLTLKLLKSDFTFIDRDNSVLRDDSGCLLHEVELGLRPELERVISLLEKL